MDGFQYVLFSVLVCVSAYIFNNITLYERNVIHGYEFSWLNLHMLIMLSAYLFIAVLF